VKTKITGKARSKLILRNLTHMWYLVKGILGENYAIWCMVDNYACKMFNDMQDKDESVMSWGDRIDERQTDLGEVPRCVRKPE
jgi:hypothetical protein